MIKLIQLMREMLVEAMTYNQLLNATDRGRRDRGGRMRTRSLAGTATEDAEQWNFAYKSARDHITTGGGHQGRISFEKDAYKTNRGKRSMNEVNCRVDCSCPDYKYRWAYANYQQDAGDMGRDSLNQCNGSAPVKNNPGERVSLCKHLVSLRDYLKTKLDEGTGDVGEKLSRIVSESPVFEIQYEDVDNMVNEGNEIDKDRIKTALAFFIKLLKLESATRRIKLKYGHLDVDSESQLPTQASVHVSRSQPHTYTITMRSNNPMSSDEQIRHLAHEVKHIQQVETGRFDVYGNKWDGVTYPTGYTKDDYLKYPWEVDARSSVMDMELQFNRYMRDRSSRSKVVKI
jgi:hypothetical protein